MLATEKNRDVIEQINKINSRIDSLSETKSNLFMFLLKVQDLYKSHSKNVQSQIENFEDLINKKSIYSVQKCLSMKKMTGIYKRILIFVEGTAKINQIQLKKIDFTNEKKQETLKKKANMFSKSVGQYSSNQQGYNKNFQQYRSHCSKLDEMIGKFKCFENPIVFYNINVGDDDSKNIEKKHHECQNKEVSLVSSLQLLDQKRKILSENLKAIQEDFVNLLHEHINSISNAVTCLTEHGEDEMQALPSTLNLDKNDGDVFKEEIQMFDNKYGKMSSGEDQILTDLKQLFGGSSSHVQITSDERLFLDRCEGFARTKTLSVQEFIYIQKMFLGEMNNQILSCQKLTKQFTAVQKSVFKSNGIEDFKKKVRKYFGEGILNVTDLCFIVLDVPRMRFEKIGKFIQSFYEKMQKCLRKKEEELKRFKKKINQVFEDHHNASKGVQNNLVSVNEFKGTIEKTFSLFRNYFGEFCKNQSEIDAQFQEMVKKIISFVERQSSHMNLSYTLNKQKQRFLFEMFQNFVLNIQIVDIVKEDTRYQILFNDCLKPDLFNNFKSQISKKEFQQTKRILQKKQIQSKGMIVGRSGGCCGLQSNKTKRYKRITDHNVDLIQQGERNRSGIFQIFQEGICFEEKKKNPFCQKISMAISKNEILSYAGKTLKDGQQGIQILTNMGSVYFISDEVTEVQKSLEDNIMKHTAVRQLNDSRRDRSNDSSSFFKQNNTSSQYKVSFEKSIIGFENQIKDKNRKSNNEVLVLQKLTEEFKKTILFSNLFTMSSQQTSEENSRIDYQFKNDLNKFLLKEKRFAKMGGKGENFMFVYFNWKVSFPEMPMLKSFTHGEEIKISLTPMLARIVIIQKNRGDSYLFVRKTFYSQVEKMNKKLSDFVVSIVEREAEVIIEQEKVELEDSTLNLDVQNLALDKEEVQNKGLFRIPSGSICVESDKNNSRLNPN